MAGTQVDISQLLTSLTGAIQALEKASTDLHEAQQNVENLAQLVQMIGETRTRARIKYQNKLHHREFQDTLLSLAELETNFQSRVAEIRKALHVKGLRWFFVCCWYAVVGDKVVKVAQSMNSQLQNWMQRHDVSESIDEILDRQAQRLSSIAKVQDDNAYQPIRAKVERVLELLGNNLCKVVLVHGLSGIGKSSLVSYIAARCERETFPDGAAKLVLGSACSMRANAPLDDSHKSVDSLLKVYHKNLAAKFSLLLVQLNRNNGVREQSEMNLDQVFRELEASLKGKRYLVILDDVWEPEIVTRLLRLDGNYCKYLVTSRFESVLEISNGENKVELRKEDAQEVGDSILRFHCGLEQLPAEAEELLRCCGYHPLTLAVMGRVLHGEMRRSQWKKAINDLRIYAAQEAVPTSYLLDRTEDAVTIFGSFDLSLKAMKRYTSELFTLFAVLSWLEPIPEECLAQLWHSLQQYTTFRLQIQQLVKGSLLRIRIFDKRFDCRGETSIWYDVHDMLALYLDGKLRPALEVLHSVYQDPHKAAAVAPWLFRYGKQDVKAEAERVLIEALKSKDEALLAKVMPSIQGVCDACLLYMADANPRGAASYFNKIVGPALLILLSKSCENREGIEAAVRYIGRHFTPAEWKMNLKDLMGVGAMEKVAKVLREGSGAAQDAAIGAVEWIVHFLDKVVLQDAHKRGLSELQSAVRTSKAGKEAQRCMFMQEISNALAILRTPDKKQVVRDMVSYSAAYINDTADRRAPTPDHRLPPRPHAPTPPRHHVNYSSGWRGPTLGKTEK